MGAVFLAAWAWGATHGPYDWGDTADYLQQAENIRNGRGWSSGTPEATRADPRLASRRLPGYGAVLALVQTVSQAPAWLGFVQSLLGVALAWGLWRVAARIGPREGRPLALGIALTPVVWIVAQVPMSDLPFAALLLLATERVVAYTEHQHNRDLAFAHIALGVAFLLKPVLLYFWPVSLVLTGWMLWRRGARGLRLWPAAAAGLVPLLALALALAHGAQTGVPEVTSLQTQNLWQQNARRALIRTGEHDRYVSESARLARIESYSERQRQTAVTAQEAILSRPLAYAAVHFTGTAAFLLDPGRYDLAIFFELPVGSTGGMDAASRGARPLARFLAGLPWPLVLVLGLLALLNAAIVVAFLAWVWRGPAPLDVRMWAFCLVGYLAFITGPVGAARYRLAVVPLLFLALPWAWDACRTRLRA